jgi:hypothetical protein
MSYIRKRRFLVGKIGDLNGRANYTRSFCAEGLRYLRNRNINKIIAGE